MDRRLVFLGPSGSFKAFKIDSSYTGYGGEMTEREDDFHLRV